MQKCIQLTGTNARGLDHKLCSMSKEFNHICMSYLLFSYTVLRVQTLNHTGGYYHEATPVPIPNTEVKLAGADNTWLETARKDRLLPVYISPFTLKVKGLFHWKKYYKHVTKLLFKNSSFGSI